MLVKTGHGGKLLLPNKFWLWLIVFSSYIIITWLLVFVVFLITWLANVWKLQWSVVKVPNVDIYNFVLPYTDDSKGERAYESQGPEAKHIFILDKCSNLQKEIKTPIHWLFGNI